MSDPEVLDEVRAAMAAARFPFAIELLERRLQSASTDAEAWFLLGACLDRCGRPQNALDAFSTAEKLRPDMAQAVNAQAAMLSALGRWMDALVTYRRALALLPNDAQLLTNIGIVLENLAQTDDALEHYNAALTANPRQAVALTNRGGLLLQLSRPKDALADYRRFTEQFPWDASGHFNCAQALAALLQDQAALEAADTALRMDPKHVKAHIVRGAMLAGLARFEEARVAFDTARRLAPMAYRQLFAQAGLNSDDPEYLYCLRGKDRLQRCDWSGYPQFVTNFARVADRLAADPSAPDPIALCHFSVFLPLPPEVHGKLARRTAALREDTVTPPLRHTSRQDRKRLRIGYVSPDFRNHPTAHVLSRLYELHDRRAFEIYGYSLRQGDGSELAARIAASCDVFHECQEWPVERVIRRIRDDGIDILVDLAGYTDFARPEIFASRPAPINVAMVGYPATTGAAYMDYRITDRVATLPADEHHYTEKLVILHGGCLGYNDRFVIEDAGIRHDNGLPDEAFVFCCFNSPYKIEPAIFAVWMRILRQCPRSVLWLYSPRPEVQYHLTRAAAAHGIGADRLVFAAPLPFARNAGRYRLADLFLDTAICCGHSTTMDSLWAGLPLLTLRGDRYAARIGASHLTSLGLPELIASDIEDYERIACELYADAATMNALKNKTRSMRDSAVIFNSETFRMEIEDAYRRMWERYIDALEPDHIMLP